ncbi:peptidoglycan recognition family protein [Stenotrophomonas sp. Iso1]|uniref:peptidoglycan recognition protein family protein n=1 Tax=Stenotrophomonas sp. Iso1 TaxID=2977283 RepID=UPI0022B77245|nr:peptidoglycan recognition family protein [Stenotrophomonas sp. Iso1]
MSPMYRPVAESETSPVALTQRHSVVLEPYVDTRGWIQNAGFHLKRVAALEKGAIDGPKAVVLHRTQSSTIESPLKSFESGIGTHFIIDKDGAVHQCASLLMRTAHVGRIRSRCYESASCPVEEARMIKSWGWAPARLHDHEKSKTYPHRFPMNEDSVGVETVASFDGTSWERPTPAQEKSIKALIQLLQRLYGLTDSDVHEHDNISYKTPGEGDGLYSPSSAYGLPPLVQPRFPFPT